jgi:hypothetical protein
MIDNDDLSSTSEYTESYLDGLDTSEIDGGKGKCPKAPKKAKGLKSPKKPKPIDVDTEEFESEDITGGKGKGPKAPKKAKGLKSPKKPKPIDVDTEELFDEFLDSEPQTSPSKKKSKKSKSKYSEEFESDSDLESQVRQSFGKKSKGIESMTNVKPSIVNLSKLNQPQPIDSEEELGSVINNYIPQSTARTSSSKDHKSPSGISKLDSIATQMSQHIPQSAQTISNMAQNVPNVVSSVAQMVDPNIQPQFAQTMPQTVPTTNINPSVNFSSLDQAYTIVPMLVPTSTLYKGQFGGKINRKLEKVNKQIEALENKLF